jgi:hypothetical protein
VALSPSIPTSFVPKQPVSTDKRRFASGGNNVLLILASVILALTVLAAGGTFLYQQYLKKAEAAKSAQILAEQKQVSADSVNKFIRLRDRLAAAKTVLNQHIVLSQFFNLLETITLQNVHFDGVSIEIADDRSAKITMTGQAKDFNALENQSTVFANQQYIKSAIFSGISVNKDNSVSFTVTANLDPAVVIEKTPVSEQSVPVFGPVPATQNVPTVSTVPVSAQGSASAAAPIPSQSVGSTSSSS